MSRHYIPAEVWCDENYEAQAKRAGALDKLHGYPKQDSDGIAQTEIDAYEQAYDQYRRI